jgi:hypothetical protein
VAFVDATDIPLTAEHAVTGIFRTVAMVDLRCNYSLVFMRRVLHGPNFERV